MSLAVLLVLALASGATRATGAAPPAPADVYLVIVDGLGADMAVPERMPRLAAAAARAGGSWLTATAVMPTRTNANHASLLTGTQPAAHGITGNWYWNGTAERELGEPRLLEVETLFTAIERQRHELVTGAAFAKGKLRRLFAAAGDRQAGPDVSWRPAHDDLYAASDDEAMDGFRKLVATHHPALSVVAIADVDAAGHRDGPDAPAYGTAVAHADQLIGAFLDDLERTGRWERAVVVVTADHGFEALRPGTEGQIEPAAVAGRGAHLVSDGGVAHVYGASDGSIDATIAKARRHEGVAAVYAPVPRPDVPVPPREWHLAHPRTGDLLLVARPGFTFVDGPRDPTRGFRGNHGGPDERLVPLVVIGGHPALRRAPAGLRPSVVDVAPTMAHLLHLTPPARLDRAPLAAGDQGRVLVELLGGQ